MLTLLMSPLLEWAPIHLHYAYWRATVAVSDSGPSLHSRVEPKMPLSIFAKMLNFFLNFVKRRILQWNNQLTQSVFVKNSREYTRTNSNFYKKYFFKSAVRIVPVLHIQYILSHRFSVKTNIFATQIFLRNLPKSFAILMFSHKWPSIFDYYSKKFSLKCDNEIVVQPSARSFMW
jgi:hypothetical protein